MDDIREEKRDESGPLDNDRRLRRLLALMPEAIFANTGGRLSFVNAAAQQLFGRSEAAMLGRSPLEFIHPDSQDLARGRIAMLTAGALDVPTVELKIVRENGTTRIVESTAARIEEHGEASILTIMRDVTERRQTELGLLASKARLEAALASMTDAVLITDAAGNLIEFNDAFVTVHRFAGHAECRSSLADYPALFDLYAGSGEPVPFAQWPVLRALRGETETNVEFSLRRKDTGATWEGSYSFAPIRSPEGEIVGAVVTGRDISGLKRIHAELAASHADLRRLVAAMDRIEEDERRRIARDLHDDLGQTLAAARIKLAALGACGNAEIRAGAREIDALIAGADRASRSLAAQLAPPVLYELGLVPALEWLAEELHRNFGLEVEMVDDGAPHLLAPAVGSIVYRAVRELLINVAKHAKVGAAMVELAGAEGSLIVRVHDAGVGFVPEQVARVTQRGIGLASVRERVSFIGGTIEVRSIPNDGTMVELTVPLEPIPEETDRTAS